MKKNLSVSVLVPGIGCFAFFILLLPGLPVPAYGNDKKEPDLSGVIEKVEKYYQSLQDLQSHFVQLARMMAFPEDQRSEGTVYLKRKEKMRWDYEEPSKDQYFINGEDVIFYTPEVRQARRIRLMGGQGVRSPLVFFEGLKSAEPDYIMSFNNEPIFDRSTRIVLQLTPRDREKIPLSRILLFVDKSDFHVQRVDQYDLYGNVTELYFKDVKVNQKLPDSHFVFKPAKGVEVIDQR